LSEQESLDLSPRINHPPSADNVLIARFKDKEYKIINELANQLGDPAPSIRRKD